MDKITRATEIAIVGSGFAGSLLARILATIGYDVMLIERGHHPRFAIGESSTPMANLTLERLGARYGMADCRALATHGRWMRSHPELMRGLKRGFTFYRHHPGAALNGDERLLVAASPDDEIADAHWLRADVDHHFVREAIAAGVEYLEGVEVTEATAGEDGVRMRAKQSDGTWFDVHATFLVDASGPGGFAAKHFFIPSALAQTETRSSLVFSHFTGVELMADLVPDMPRGPYPDDWAALHHLIDEGWMYCLRFDNGVTSAGISIRPESAGSLQGRTPSAMWDAIVERYPTIAAAFANAAPMFPIRHVPRVQHRLAAASGECWTMLPHAFAFVDPLFSTGIAWGLRCVERLALAFERARDGAHRPSTDELQRYSQLLTAEADMIDRLVATSYDAMAHFEIFVAHAMIYFALVSFGEVRQRFWPDESWAWSAFLDAGDPATESMVAESQRRVREMLRTSPSAPDPSAIREYADWISSAIAPRNIAGLADPARRHLYPVDIDLLVERHDLLGLTREEIQGKLPLLRL